MGRNGKKAANQHNPKHENGIVAPGKRVTKQKSNGHLNGSVDGSIGSSATSPAKGANIGPVVTSASNTSPQDGPDSPTRADPRSSPAPKLVSQHSQNDSASDEPEASDSIPARASEIQHKGKIIDVSTAKHSISHDGGAIKVALTVLKSSTTADVLTILVLLLSVPSAFIHTVNIGFSAITFVPPTGSFTTLPSLSDITSSFSPGAPSLVVLVLLDLIAICIWSVIPWPHVQAIILDCAQANVATTIGGGHSLTPGSTDNLLYFMVFVILTHFGRYRRTLLKWLHRTPLAKHLPLIESLDDLPLQSPYVLSSERSWFDTVQVWLALHILLQGLTRVVRRALNSPRDSPFGGRIIDPEANNNSSSLEATELMVPSSPSAMKTKASLQNLREARDKPLSNKKRKKQANWARSQQPLWAAVAEFKVKYFREHQQSKATRDARVVRAADAQDLGSAPFAKEDSKIWITMVLSDKMYFETGPMLCASSSNTNGQENEAGVIPDPPFYVRVNGAAWPSLKTLSIQDEETVEGKSRWIGEIYGLSAANTYNVSWIREDTDVELHFEIIVTPSLGIDQADSSTTAPPQTLRPSSPASPIATVKAAIVAYENNINDLAAAQKRIRKENKANRARLEKDIESLNEKSARGGATTKTLSQRQSQIENNIKQTDDAISAISQQINEIESAPEDTAADKQQHKAHYEKMRTALSMAQEDIQRIKEDTRASITNIQTKELSESQKRDRNQTRTKKLATDLANLQNSSKNPDHHRTDSMYASRAAELDQEEAAAQFSHDALRHNNHDLFEQTQNIKREVDHLEHIAYVNDVYANQNQARFAQDSRPITPEGDLPGTHPQVSAQNQSANFPRTLMFSTPETMYAVPATTGVNHANGFTSSSRNNGISSRHRSQSALSGNSVYAELEPEDEDDEDPIPLVHKRRTGLSGSDGRSSGSGSPHVHAGTVPPPPIGSERRQSPAQATPS